MPARDHAPATGCPAGAPDTALRLLARARGRATHVVVVFTLKLNRILF
jgi:hypothetical protein